MTAPLRIEKLRRDHPIDDFDCGREALNRFLIRYAFANQQAGAAQTYVGLSGEQVIGYYSLVVGQVAYDDAPQRLSKGLARHPVPIMLLARLAVRTGWQGRGIGAGLLKDALRRTLHAADIAGIRAFAVHAKDDGARAFYRHFDFLPSPTDSMHLFVLLKDLRRFLDGRSLPAARHAILSKGSRQRRKLPAKSREEFHDQAELDRRRRTGGRIDAACRRGRRGQDRRGVSALRQRRERR